MASGLLGLVGSGEFLPVMVEADRHLLEGRPKHLVHLPTAAAPEGSASLRRWADLAAEHGERLGVTVDSVPVHERIDAENTDLAERIAGAGLIYLSGGNPGYLARTLHDTVVWHRIVAAWQDGASLAGCSAGAMALTVRAPDVRSNDEHRQVDGLGLLDRLAVLPHFDRMASFRPHAVTDALAEVDPAVTVIGVDEDTAMVGDGSRWTVFGRQQVHVFDRTSIESSGSPGVTRHAATDTIHLPGRSRP